MRDFGISETTDHQRISAELAYPDAVPAQNSM